MTKRTYDDITRATVMEPDGSMRAPRDQKPVRVLDAQEQALKARVQAALASCGLDASGVDVDVDRDRVILRGRVRDTQALNGVPAAVRSVPGVGAVDDHLVIG